MEILVPKSAIPKFLLHQNDSASSHTASIMLAFLKEKNIQLVSHPRYFQDMTPCDNFLFPFVQKQVCGVIFLALKMLERPSRASFLVYRKRRDVTSQGNGFIKWRIVCRLEEGTLRTWTNLFWNMFHRNGDYTNFSSPLRTNVRF